MKHSIDFKELLERPIIRNDRPHEWLNKMTDKEIHQWEHEIEETLREEGEPEIFPDWNAAFLAKVIDYDIIYSLFKGDHLKNNIT